MIAAKGCWVEELGKEDRVVLIVGAETHIPRRIQIGPHRGEGAQVELDSSLLSIVDPLNVRAISSTTYLLAIIWLHHELKAALGIVITPLEDVLHHCFKDVY